VQTPVEDLEVFAGWSLSAAYYDIEFDNRIIFLDNQSTAGPNYIIGTNGTYFNAGGIESDGLEVSLTWDVTDTLLFYVAYTDNTSEYIGTGDSAVDAELGVTPGNTVVNMPETQLVLSLAWEDGPYLEVGGVVISDSPEKFNFPLVLNNAFDEDYLAGISSQGVWPGAPRTVSSSVSLAL